MEPVVSRDYVLIYFHSLVLSENLPDSNFIKDIYNLVDDKWVYIPPVSIVHGPTIDSCNKEVACYANTGTKHTLGPINK